MFKFPSASLRLCARTALIVNPMKVSVIVPVRDEEDSIRELLDTLLAQTRPPDAILARRRPVSNGWLSLTQVFVSRKTGLKRSLREPKKTIQSMWFMVRVNR